MSLFIASLNSGSNGNCYYVGNERDAVLIDAGISCRETENRMKRIGLSMNKVRAIFISHEHSDHIRGVEVLAKKHGLPVYITPLTYRHGGLMIDSTRVVSFADGESVNVGSLTVTAFSKQHDAAHPHSFMVSYNNINVGVFTDIGIACNNLTTYFKQCHAAFLEANYDEDMLENGRYPYHLKRRIRGGSGHLSNRQALDVFINHRGPLLTHLLLAHLSRDNNDPALVQNLFQTHAGNIRVVVASRYEASAVYHINGLFDNDVLMPVVQGQFSLF